MDSRGARRSKFYKLDPASGLPRPAAHHRFDDQSELHEFAVRTKPRTLDKKTKRSEIRQIVESIARCLPAGRRDVFANNSQKFVIIFDLPGTNNAVGFDNYQSILKHRY